MASALHFTWSISCQCNAVCVHSAEQYALWYTGSALSNVFSRSLCIVQEQLLEEQKSILGQLYVERRALAEERAQFNLNQKLKMEQEQRENLKVMKVCR